MTLAGRASVSAGAATSSGRRRLPGGRWTIAVLISAAIAISYLDRQTLPWAIKYIQADIPISNQAKAALDSAFLATYGLMYLGGGWLLDRIGTRRGFLVVMLVWSVACASHGLAAGLAALSVSRLLLGAGEGGSFPAATRAIAEWFPPEGRAAAMGLVNAGSAVGAVAAPPLIALILTSAHGFGLSSWRWVFFITGLFGLAWAVAWWAIYRPAPVGDLHPRRGHPHPALRHEGGGEITDSLALADLLRRREVAGVVGAKFLSDGAWYFYLFWLPKYLFEARHVSLVGAASTGWIPYAASGVGSVCGGWLSSALLRRGRSVNFARKTALGLSAALMPWVVLVPLMPNVGLVLLLFSLAFFGQQSWSTLIMTLPTDLVPSAALGRLAGLVGMGGAFGGVLMGQTAGWMLDHGYSYAPVLAIAGSLHVIAFVLICLALPRIEPLVFHPKGQP